MTLQAESTFPIFVGDLVTPNRVYNNGPFPVEPGVRLRITQYQCHGYYWAVVEDPSWEITHQVAGVVKGSWKYLNQYYAEGLEVVGKGEYNQRYTFLTGLLADIKNLINQAYDRFAQDELRRVYLNTVEMVANRCDKLYDTIIDRKDKESRIWDTLDLSVIYLVKSTLWSFIHEQENRSEVGNNDYVDHDIAIECCKHVLDQIDLHRGREVQDISNLKEVVEIASQLGKEVAKDDD
jgi:hypothetical protein